MVKHYTATVYILSDTRPRKALLVHHRKSGMWMPPGGHQEADENALEAALREVKEETGLDVAGYMAAPVAVGTHAHYLPLPRYMLETRVPAREDEAEHYHLDMEYVVEIPEQTVSHQLEESHGIGWFDLAEFENLPTFEDIRQVLSKELAV